MKKTLVSLATVGVASVLALSALPAAAIADTAESDEAVTLDAIRMAGPVVPPDDSPFPGTPATDAGEVDPADDEPTDTTPGVFTLTSPGPDAVIASGSTIVVDFSCSDPESAIASCVLLDHESESLGVGQEIVLADGEYEWRGESVNGAGLRTTAVFTFIVTDDTEVPTVVTDYVEPVSGWVRAITIQFDASDDVSGVDAIFVQQDGGEIFSATGPSLRYVADPGEHVLEYWATDRLGRESEHHSITVRSDGVKPEISVVPFGTVNADGEIEVEQGADLEIEFDCTDDLSGIEFCGVPALASHTVRTDVPGEYSVEVRARDLAQNVATEVVSFVVVEEFSDPTTPDDPSNPADPPAEQSGVPAPRGAVTSQDQLASTGADPILPVGIAALLLLAGASTLAYRQYRNRGPDVS